MSFFLSLLCLVLLTEALTELAIKSQIFLPIRLWFSHRSNFLKELLHCGYCFSVWAAIGVVLACGISIPLTERGIINVPITILVVHRLSNYLHNFNDKILDKYYSISHINTQKEDA